MAVGLTKVALTDLTSPQLDKVLYKLQLTSPEDYDEEGKLGLLHCGRVFHRGTQDFRDEDLLAVFNKKGLFVDFESRNGKLRGLFPKSDSNKVMYPCSVCCLEVTNRNDTTGLGIECGGCGWYFHSKCTEKPLSLELFKALKDSPNYVKVLCPPCNSVYGSAHSKLRRIEKQVEHICDKVDEVDSSLTEIKPSYSAILGSKEKGKAPLALPPKIVSGLKIITEANLESQNADRLKRSRVVLKPEDTSIRTSKDIRRAFNRHIQGVVIKHCRLTASGSILFEFDDEQTASGVHNSWSDAYFGGNKGMKIPGDFNTVGIIKHVYDDHSQADMEREILQNYKGLITKCEFQKKRSDSSFNGMIKVEFSSRDELPTEGG